MKGYHNILDKLNRFSRKYYTKILMKGGLLFLSLGLLFFLVILAVEYFLWLNSTGRLLLLLVFVAVELFLLFKYILTPIFYLFRLKRGISNKQASVLIGRHFPEVGDKLYNLLDLAGDTDRSELLLASMEQRSKNLNPIPFTKAINFKENLKYAKYVAIPLLVFGLIWFSGNLSSFFGSYDRVMNYHLAYEPPAPFTFNLLSGSLDVLESQEYVIQVTTEGNVRPEDVFIVIDGKEFLLQEQMGLYNYTLSPPLQQTDFYFMANGIKSRPYTLNALKTPSIQDFNIILEYPKYTNRPTETLRSTGNATFPEGTKVKWEIKGRHTDNINLILKDTSLQFAKTDNAFVLSRKIYSDLPYQLSTSNKNVAHYETLDYRFEVIKDAYPTIRARQVLDSLNPNVSYYVGEASDDYKLAAIKLVCYPDDDPRNMQIVELGRPNANFDQFYYTFPSGLRLDKGKNYSFYFEATDNDAIHKGKTARSQAFSLLVLDDNQLKNKQLEFQQSLLDNMDKSLDRFKEQKEILKEINKEQKEKSALNFNDQNRIKDFLKKQQHQENLMQKFSKQLRENIDKEDKDDELNTLLKERLERQEMQAQKNEKLLEELNRIADKIDREELSKRLEELGKKQQNSERSLEQLVELTKRYYVTEKASQLAKDLEKLAEKQNSATDKKEDENKRERQEELNTDFEKLSEELKELKKDNADLKKPLKLRIDKSKEEGVKKDQQDALEELNRQKEEEQSSDPKSQDESGNKASQKQKSAAQKMQEMSKELQQSSSAGGSGSTITEDAEMLRQILDNLVTFSFKQEKLYDGLKDVDVDIAQFSGSVRRQRELRDLFEHIDDSLFALSLRRAELSEFVNEQITEVYYNTDKTLESMAERQMYQGVSYQQRVLTASNSLADFLAKLLDNMQQSMSGSGSGKGGGQLPDIIKSQGELKDMMGRMGKSGSGKPKEGEGESQSGSGEKQGEEGSKSGKGKKEGEEENGKNGKGQSGREGEGDGPESGQPSEQELQEIYEIYKEQQMLREQLEKQLQDLINAKDKQLARKLIEQMENFENDLLENGVTNRTMNKINNIQYELLKLENAALKQGKKAERESNTNTGAYQNPITTKPSQLENYRNEIEILNRQALPLQPIFQDKVKDYFKKDD